MGKFASPLQAELLIEDRGAMRHTLRLATDLTSSTITSPALIHDLSELGLRLETSVRLVEGESVFVDLPFVGIKETRVVWNKGRFFGCEFRSPLSKAESIASLLRASDSLARSRIEGRIEEVIVGVQPSADELAEWEEKFLRSKQAAGYQLVGFRQTSDGLTIAILSEIKQ
jgi:hypothetical protein